MHTSEQLYIDIFYLCVGIFYLVTLLFNRFFSHISLKIEMLGKQCYALITIQTFLSSKRSVEGAFARSFCVATHFVPPLSSRCLTRRQNVVLMIGLTTEYAFSATSHPRIIWDLSVIGDKSYVEQTVSWIRMGFVFHRVFQVLFLGTAFIHFISPPGDDNFIDLVFLFLFSVFLNPLASHFFSLYS